MTWLMHVANLLYLASYAVRDILWLRLITCVANLALLGMFALAPTPPLDAIAWQAVFLIINVTRLVQLLHERRPVRLDADGLRLARRFPSLRPREVARLQAAATIVRHVDGDRVITCGQPLDHLAVILDGAARVEVEGAEVARVGRGGFLGELSYLCGRPPRADVIAADALRLARWPTATLRALAADSDELAAALQLGLGADVAEKLRSAGPPDDDAPPGRSTTAGSPA